jgi:hypothetical protein
MGSRDENNTDLINTISVHPYLQLESVPGCASYYSEGASSSNLQLQRHLSASLLLSFTRSFTWRCLIMHRYRNSTSSSPPSGQAGHCGMMPVRWCHPTPAWDDMDLTCASDKLNR